MSMTTNRRRGSLDRSAEAVCSHAEFWVEFVEGPRSPDDIAFAKHHLLDCADCRFVFHGILEARARERLALACDRTAKASRPIESGKLPCASLALSPLVATALSQTRTAA